MENISELLKSEGFKCWIKYEICFTKTKEYFPDYIENTFKTIVDGWQERHKNNLKHFFEMVHTKAQFQNINKRQQLSNNLGKPLDDIPSWIIKCCANCKELLNIILSFHSDRRSQNIQWSNATIRVQIQEVT